jgi:hypothetical protein
VPQTKPLHYSQPPTLLRHWVPHTEPTLRYSKLPNHTWCRIKARRSSFCPRPFKTRAGCIARRNTLIRALLCDCLVRSSRTPFDRMKSLWCSWAVVTEGARREAFYFGGDSGYCPAFKEIGRELGPFDVAGIPIGAYEPRWFMHPQHVDPQQAVQVRARAGLWVCTRGLDSQVIRLGLVATMVGTTRVCGSISARLDAWELYRIMTMEVMSTGQPPLPIPAKRAQTSVSPFVQVHQDVRAKHSFGIHWGTFPLAGDDWDQAPRELWEERERLGMDPTSFFLLRPGETWMPGQAREPFMEDWPAPAAS